MNQSMCKNIMMYSFIFTIFDSGFFLVSLTLFLTLCVCVALYLPDSSILLWLAKKRYYFLIVAPFLCIQYSHFRSKHMYTFSNVHSLEQHPLALSLTYSLFCCMLHVFRCCCYCWFATVCSVHTKEFTKIKWKIQHKNLPQRIFIFESL